MSLSPDFPAIFVKAAAESGEENDVENELQMTEVQEVTMTASMKLSTEVQEVTMTASMKLSPIQRHTLFVRVSPILTTFYYSRYD